MLKNSAGPVCIGPAPLFHTVSASLFGEFGNHFARSRVDQHDVAVHAHVAIGFDGGHFHRHRLRNLIKLDVLRHGRDI